MSEERRKTPRDPLDDQRFALMHAMFLALLGVSPLWYGGVGYVSLALQAITAACLAVAVSIFLATRGIETPIPWKTIAAPTTGLCLIVAWAIWQAIGPPFGMANAGWAAASQMLAIDIPPRISVSPVQSLFAATQMATGGLIFWLALQFGSRGKRAKFALTFIGMVATANALWGLLDNAVGWDHVLFEAKDKYAVHNLNGYVSGTFRNRDHFGVYCGLGLCCFLARMASVGRGVVKGVRMGHVETRHALRLCGFLICGAILAAGIWMSRGRSVLALTLLATFFFIVVMAWRIAARGSRLIAYALMGLCGVAVLLVGIMILADPLATDRFAKLGDAMDGKVALYRDILSGIIANPLAGVGAGAFGDGFPAYRSEELGFGGFWNAAHNIYLEALFTYGVPFGLLIFLVFGWALWRVLMGAARRQHQLGAPLAACSASLLVFGHGFVDFSIYTTGVGFTLAAILGYACAQSWTHAERRLAGMPA